MELGRITSLILALCFSAHAQILSGIMNVQAAGGGFSAITVDASCNGNNQTPGSSFAFGCSSPMTVTAGDTIECVGSGTNFGAMSAFFTDNLNGTYDTIEQLPHPNSANAGVIVGVFQNSSGGSITPQMENWEPQNINLYCRALKNTRTSLVVDGGSVNQTNSQSSAAANPTSGAAAAPTNNSEYVGCDMARPSVATVTGGTGFSPGGTLTGVPSTGSNYPLYDQYDVQTTATAVNCPYTASSAEYVDSQFALLNASNPAGYRAFTGMFGAPAIAKTNGATVTLADLNGATTTLATIPKHAGWTLGEGSLSAVTYTTAIAPTGTGKILLQGVGHTFGDAGTSIQFAGSINSGNANVTDLLWTGYGTNLGQEEWLGWFARVGSSGLLTATECDELEMDNTVTEATIDLQVVYSTANQLYFFFEYSIEGTSTYNFMTALATDTDYWFQVEAAGVNDRYHKFLVYTKSGSTWTLSQSFTADILCTPAGQGLGCQTPTPVASTTGTATSSSTALVVASGTSIVVGQIVVGTGIPWLTTVTAVAGTSVTLSQNTTAPLSSTAVGFYTPPSKLITATSGTASSGSTALTIVANTYGTIAENDPVGGAGIQEGTVVQSVTGTAVTLSLPTSAAISAGSGVSFWAIPGSAEFLFGKYSSCSMASPITYSAWAFDPYNDWGAFAPN